MTISMVMCRPTQPPVMNVPCSVRPKEKVVLVMGATGTGKSRLSIELATRFPSEIINSDKIQVYEGLEVTTNKVPAEERLGVPHHLLGTQHPDSDFTAADFCHVASGAIESISRRGMTPIVAGGSNSYLEELLERHASRYDCCCLWVDVAMPVLDTQVSRRVDDMVCNGMVDELKPFYSPLGDYSRGIRRAIGVPEFDSYFRSEGLCDDETRQRLMRDAIGRVKENTRALARKQLDRIRALRSVKRWRIHRVCSTRVFELPTGEEADDAWRRLVAEPCARVVAQFLYGSDVVCGVRVPAAGSNKSVVASAACKL